MPFWGRPLTSLLLAAVIALLIGLSVGATWGLASFSIYLLAQVLHHLRNLHDLAIWLRSPTSEAVPSGSGSWETVYYNLRKLTRVSEQRQHNLTKALDRFRQAAEAMPDGVVILDQEGHVDWCNTKAIRHFELDPQQDRGHQITNVVRQPEFVDYLASQQWEQSLVLRNLRGQDVVLSIQVVPFDETQRLMLSRDITQVDRMQMVHRDFVANVSHELRTPLTVVSGFVETLIDTPSLPREQAERYLELMHQQSSRMQRLVEDLLTLSKLENADNRLREETVDVTELLQQVLGEGESLSAGRHQVELHLETSLQLQGNRDELHSAFGNLVSNAIRYTPEGGCISITWKEVPQGAALLVQDTGIGIEARHLTRITERFYRVDRSRSRETGGTGLGLAIVKHVLTRHQGRLEVESVLGKGSTFSARFPAHRTVAA